MKASEAIVLILAGATAGWFAKQAYDNHIKSVLKNTEGCPICDCKGGVRLQGIDNGYIKIRGRL